MWCYGCYKQSSHWRSWRLGLGTERRAATGMSLMSGKFLGLVSACILQEPSCDNKDELSAKPQISSQNVNSVDDSWATSTPSSATSSRSCTCVSSRVFCVETLKLHGLCESREASPRRCIVCCRYEHLHTCSSILGCS